MFKGGERMSEIISRKIRLRVNIKGNITSDVLKSNLNFFTSIRFDESPEKADFELSSLVLKVADEVFLQSASNFERAVASRILNRKCGGFRVLTIEDFLADIVCNGEKWKGYRNKIQNLGYMIELAPLVLFMLIEDERMEDAKELFYLATTTEVNLQKRGNEFSDIYTEIMGWVAKKLELGYSPPKNLFKSSENYSKIIRVVLNYGEVTDSYRVSEIKHAARQILKMLSNDVLDIRILYFVWKLSTLLSIPQLSLKDQITFIVWRRRKNWVVYHTIRILPEILAGLVTILFFHLLGPVIFAIPSGITLIDILPSKYLPDLVRKTLRHRSYVEKVKKSLENDKQLLKKLRKLDL
jgi:hypothetical protein